MHQVVPRWIRAALAAGSAVAAILGTSAGSAQAFTTGSPWRVFQRFHSATDSGLGSLAVVSARDAWAAGSIGSSPLVMHWNGARWLRLATPGLGSFQPYYLRASSASNVWMFGTVSSSDTTGEIARRTGRTWTTQPLPTTSVLFSSPVVLGPKDAWIVSDLQCPSNGAPPCRSILSHWDGSTWTSFPVGAFVNDMSASGPRDVWAAGVASHHVVAYRWNGVSWHKVASMPNQRPGNGPNITAPSSHNVWITGALSARGHSGYALHWNGRSWQERWAPAGFDSFGEPVSDGHRGVWVGPWTHWTGAGWLAATMGPSLLNKGPFAIHSFARIPGTSSLWGVGDIRRTPNSKIGNAMIVANGAIR